jgi:two-component system nitrate/nitrite response regulator NarL
MEGDMTAIRSMPIRVALVDDHPLVRSGTAATVGREPDVELIDFGETLADAQRLLARRDLDVVILDIRLATDSGLAALDERHAGRPAVLILTSYDLPQYADAALRLGAAGFVSNTAPATELIAAIRRIAAGGLYFGIRPGGRVVLSEREFEVVRLVVDGRSNDEIASHLGITSKTVENHLGRIFERLDVVSRTELATRALREGWLELPPAARAR